MGETIAEHGVLSFTVPPMFPCTVKVGGTAIELRADGTWSGDRDAFIAALERQQRDYSGSSMPILWLIANAIQKEMVGKTKAGQKVKRGKDK